MTKLQAAINACMAPSDHSTNTVKNAARMVAEEVVRLAEQLMAAQGEISAIRQVRQHGCECSDSDACSFLVRAEKAEAKVKSLEQELAEAKAGWSCDQNNSLESRRGCLRRRRATRGFGLLGRPGKSGCLVGFDRRLLKRKEPRP